MIILTGIEIFVIVEFAFETSMGGGPLSLAVRLRPLGSAVRL